MSICVCINNTHICETKSQRFQEKKKTPTVRITNADYFTVRKNWRIAFGVTLIFPSTSSTYILYIFYIFSLFLIIALQSIFITQYYTNNIPMYQVEWL